MINTHYESILSHNHFARWLRLTDGRIRAIFNKRDSRKNKNENAVPFFNLSIK